MTHQQKLFLAYFLCGLVWGIFAGILLTLLAEKKGWLIKKEV